MSFENRRKNLALEIRERKLVLKIREKKKAMETEQNFALKIKNILLKIEKIGIKNSREK